MDAMDVTKGKRYREVERIDKNIEQIISTLSDSLYDIENFCMDNETRTSLGRRFPDLFWNIYDLGKD